MTMIRYNPWHMQTQLQDELKQVLGKIFSVDESVQSNVVTSQWAPQVDIKEEPGRFVLHADIPGVDPKNIEIHMEKGILSIKGERKVETKEESEKYTRIERAHGIFYRRFSLPDAADQEGISASGKHGVLEIVIPKKAETTSRRIAIES